MCSEPPSSEPPSSGAESTTPTPAGAPLLTTKALSKCYHVYAHPRDRLKQFFARKDKRYYREFWALRDVDLQVYPGETLGIVGRNGAGKSTLLQLIVGTLKPTAGEVHRHGRITALLELGSGFHQDFTGRENVYLAGSILGMDHAEMDARMPQIESFADIGEFLDRPVKTYSKGMYARLSFSVYANLDPEVFIVDEALAVGDARFRHKCMYRFKQMQEQGVAILYVSHDAASMKHMCDRVAWLEAGKLEQCGDPNTVVDDYLNHLFHGVRRGAPAGDGEVRGDDDLGSRDCAFVSAQMFDAEGHRVDHLTAGSRGELRLVLQNERLDPAGDPLLVGFSISSLRGIAITGSNTFANDVHLQLPPVGGQLTVRFAFTVPAFVPGSYAITLTASTMDPAGETRLCHLVPNALHLQTSNPKKVFGLLGLDCDITTE